MFINDIRELQHLCATGTEAEVCEYVAGLSWEDLQDSYRIINEYGITEDDVMRWIYFNLK